MEIYRKAIEIWGLQAQMIVLLEEMGELQQAICKYFRDRYGDVLRVEVEIVEEMTDVLIMLEQISIGLNIKEKVDYVKRQKLDRLAQKLDRLAERLKV